ncbi:MAG TPA: peptidoglycan DD-metalloendopeptidase family protein [Bacillota bacterium]|nr:peptidoglycan DD-metalloendopeptidase family protein [Bacillota bacterium]
MRNKLIVLLILCLFLPAAFATANEITERQQELDALKRQMQEAERRAQQVERDAKSVLSELNRLEQEMDRVAADLRSVETRIIDVERELVTVNDELTSAEARLAERNSQLSTRLRALYERGAVSYIEVLLTSRSFSDFINRFLVLRTVVNHDVEVYHAVQDEKAMIEDYRVQVEVKKAELLALRQQTANHQATLKARTANRTVLLSNLNNEKAETEKAFAEMERLASELDKIIKDLQAKYAAGVGTGVLTWPTPESARITSPFGWRIHPISRVREFHSGIDIGGLPTGRKIVAADSGMVILADWFGGYGKTVIIDHGKGITTLYAHTSQILVKEGQTVAKGQVIAHVGSTGMSTGPHLHFEVRVKGTRVNPLDHVKPR